MFDVPVPHSEVPSELVEACNASRILWACTAADEVPWTMRVQYVHADGTVRRVEAHRPWRASGWRTDPDAVVADPGCRGTGRAAYEIAVLSVPRTVDYFTETMLQVRERFAEVPTHVVTNGTSPAYLRWATAPNVSVHVVPIPRDHGLRARSILMYEYALSVSPSDVLVLEDDVAVHPRALQRLDAARAELAVVREVASYVLDCYVVSWQGRNPAYPLPHTFLERDYGCCTQCMYFSQNATRPMRERMRVERTSAPRPDPYDFLIRNASASRGIPLYGTVRALVQHRGAVSTGLTGVRGLHQTARYGAVATIGAASVKDGGTELHLPHVDHGRAAPPLAFLPSRVPRAPDGASSDRLLAGEVDRGAPVRRG